MKAALFRKVMGYFAKRRGCRSQLNERGNCKTCDGAGCWWAITIRGGTTFIGKSGPHDAGEMFLMESGCENHLLTVVLITEIVAIAEIEERATAPDEVAPATSSELTSLRKEVGRLYGIIKDMERESEAA